MSAISPEPWRFGREDRIAWLIVLLPFLVALPQLVGFLRADPALYTAAMALEEGSRIQRGTPYIDPNNGFGTQALGKLATWLWLQGTVPWWNHYTGIGMPLAAEYQPGAFSPLTFLQLLPWGMAWHQLALQVIAGLGTYGLLRQLGCGRHAATAGGLLFAFNGTLAWFSHGPATAVPFLPWMLWGVERVAIFAHSGTRGGWGMLAAAMAFSLLAAFPETAYLNGLLALAWTIVRGLQLPRARRGAYARGIVAGGLTGIAIAAPQVYSFLEYLRHADIGEHGERFAHEAMGPDSILPSLGAPYFYGPIFGYVAPGREWLNVVWGGIGGYVTLALVVAAAAGFWTRRRDAISWLLLAWCMLALARTWGFPGASHLWNLVPGISLAAFYRYACPTWELALIVLAIRGLDSWAGREEIETGARRAGLAMLALGALGFAWIVGKYVGPLVSAHRPLLNWSVGSTILCFALAAAAALLAGRPRAARLLAAILVAEALVMYAIPTLSNPRAGRVDMAAIQFLRDNLGFHRFFTLGPIQPNYGAYFRLSSINYNVLPNSKKWFSWVKTHLDRNADSVALHGARGGPSSSADELRRNLAAYEEVGVRFVVTWPNQDPFGGSRPKVYSDAAMDIYMLSGAKPYYDSAGSQCKLDAADRNVLVADCKAPDRVFRRELFFPGWRATSGGKDLPITEHLDLYQSVELPAGRHEVRFSYAPPHIAWAWIASLLGLASAASLFVRRGRVSRATGPAGVRST